MPNIFKRAVLALTSLCAFGSAWAADLSGLDSVATALENVGDKANDKILPAIIALVIISVVISGVGWFARKAKPKG